MSKILNNLVKRDVFGDSEVKRLISALDCWLNEARGLIKWNDIFGVERQPVEKNGKFEAKPQTYQNVAQSIEESESEEDFSIWKPAGEFNLRNYESHVKKNGFEESLKAIDALSLYDIFTQLQVKFMAKSIYGDDIYKKIRRKDKFLLSFDELIKFAEQELLLKVNDAEKKGILKELQGAGCSKYIRRKEFCDLLNVGSNPDPNAEKVLQKLSHL